MPTKRKLAVLLIKDKLIIISHFYLIIIHIFNYPDSRLSGLFTEVPMSPDNRGSTVLMLGCRGLMPKSDNHLISPYNITPESHINVTRIKEMITN